MAQQGKVWFRAGRAKMAEADVYRLLRMAYGRDDQRSLGVSVRPQGRGFRKYEQMRQICFPALDEYLELLESPDPAVGARPTRRQLGRAEVDKTYRDLAGQIWSVINAQQLLRLSSP